MQKKQIKPHDSFFKNLFSKKEQAMEFLEKTTPVEIVEKLHLNTLQLDTTEYVDNNLQEYFADVVYNCDYSLNENKTETIKITFLFEHKSYKEHIPYLQLNRYMLNIWDSQIKQANKNKIKFKDFRLQPIIPIIFYHGTTKWDKQPFENYFLGTDELLLNFLPKFDYHIVDMADFPNAKISQLFAKQQLQVGLLLMKNIFYETTLLEILKEIFSKSINFVNKTQERQFYESAVTYIYYSKNNEFLNKINDTMKTIRTNQSEKFVSIADSLIMKGKIEGKIEGIEKEKKRTAYRLILEGFDNKFIATITGLEIEQIEDLRNKNSQLD